MSNRWDYVYAQLTAIYHSQLENHPSRRNWSADSAVHHQRLTHFIRAGGKFATWEYIFYCSRKKGPRKCSEKNKVANPTSSLFHTWTRFFGLSAIQRPPFSTRPLTQLYGVSSAGELQILDIGNLNQVNESLAASKTGRKMEASMVHKTEKKTRIAI